MSYAAIHAYTALQIVVTIIICIVTLMNGAPPFRVIIVALAPIRPSLMKQLWSRGILLFVDAWACQAGTPGNDENRIVQDF